MKRIRSPILFLLITLLVLRVDAQYAGGDGCGCTNTLLSQTSCTPIVNPSIFSGGDENSLASILLSQVSCSTSANPAIFLGGNESSENSILLSQASCAAYVYPNIFTGGSDSALNSYDLEQSSCTPLVYPSMFAGGIDDGYSGTALLQTSCVASADPGIYIGGNSSMNVGVTYLTACAPFADFDADTQFVCEGDTVNFTDMSLGTPLTWSWTFNGGTPLTSSAQNPFVIYNTAGSYDVQLSITTGSGGNSITKTTYIVVGAKPSASLIASGPTTFCSGDSVQLSVNPSFSSYAWSNGATTQSVFETISGNYFAVVTAANGCKVNTDTIAVSVLSNPVPLISTSGPTTLCNADTLILTSSPGLSYNWLPGSESSQAIEVTASGTYYVEVSYANGCTNISAPLNAVFGTSPATPLISASGPLTFCNGDSVILTSSLASSYLWSPGSATGQTITVKNSGTYYVETGNGTGCTAISVPVSVNVLANTATPTISASGALSFCSGDSVVLTSSPAASYSWSPGGQVSQSITVLNSGTYYVQADNGNNCPSVSASVAVTTSASPSTPTISASGPLTFCAGDSVILTASAAGSYNWLPGGQTTQSITVTSTGNYYVETGNGTGCTAS
ncbi:MAG: PKD domain-containing protein, partial [Bacteroidales bacterium]|nr:PKD domain-containing protein [Bacteroidales bacterium]